MAVNPSFRLSVYVIPMVNLAMTSTGKKAPKRRLQVRETSDAEQRQRILRFRERIMIDELGISPAALSDERRQDEAARDKVARHLFLMADGVIVGCLRLYSSDMIEPTKKMIGTFALNAFIEFSPECLSFTDHMVIAERWRGGKVAALMKAAAFKLARKSGAHFDFTYSPPALVGLYEKIGYRCYSGEYLETAEGLQVPMILVMDDIAHLKAVNSPFAKLATAKEPDPKFATWFRSTFPDAAGRPVKALRDEEQFWEYLTEQLHQNPLQGVPLFDDLTYDEARRFLHNATTLVLRSGDRLARAGDMGDEAFVMLSGNVEIRDKSDTVLARFDKGATVGEIAYLSAMPRSADIVVTKDAEVLVLNQDTFKKIIGSDPTIASKALFNLTLIMANRLRATTQQLSGYTNKAADV